MKKWPNTKFFIKVPFSDKRCNVINELLTTEQDYLENLELVRDYFIQPLTNQKVLEEDEMEIMYGLITCFHECCNYESTIFFPTKFYLFTFTR